MRRDDVRQIHCIAEQLSREPDTPFRCRQNSKGTGFNSIMRKSAAGLFGMLNSEVCGTKRFVLFLEKKRNSRRILNTMSSEQYLQTSEYKV
jgi:hypothetical protein